LYLFFFVVIDMSNTPSISEQVLQRVASSTEAMQSIAEKVIQTPFKIYDSFVVGYDSASEFGSSTKAAPSLRFDAHQYTHLSVTGKITTTNDADYIISRVLLQQLGPFGWAPIDTITVSGFLFATSALWGWDAAINGDGIGPVDLKTFKFGFNRVGAFGTLRVLVQAGYVGQSAFSAGDQATLKLYVIGRTER
jgi:hypothetical protein